MSSLERGGKRVVVVTGCAGYIGSYLTRLLLQKGYSVRCVDRLYFGSESIADLLGRPDFELINVDVRDLDETLFRDVFAVIDMAAIPNDPAAELLPQLTYDINERARARTAELAKRAGVERYILTSSCSVYGYQQRRVSESDEPNPLTVYAKANLNAERRVLALASSDYCVTILRLATVYGVSRRMRLDLVLNAMVFNALKEGKVIVHGTGEQKRPLIHVGDVSRAIVQVLEAPKDVVCNEVFNVGSNDQNFKIIELAKLVADMLNVKVELVPEMVDKRSYEVDFSKIEKRLGFKPIFDIKYGIREVYNALLLGLIKPDDRCYTVKWYKKLLEEKVIIIS